MVPSCGKTLTLQFACIFFSFARLLFLIYLYSTYQTTTGNFLFKIFKYKMHSKCTWADVCFWYCTSFIPTKIIEKNTIYWNDQCSKVWLQDRNEMPPSKNTHSFGGSRNILDDHFSLFVEVFVSQRSLLFLTQVHVLLMKEHKMIHFQITLFCSYRIKLLLFSSLFRYRQTYQHFFKESQYLFFRGDLGRQLFKLIWDRWWRYGPITGAVFILR